jgi:hypothetical protein
MNRVRNCSKLTSPFQSSSAQGSRLLISVDGIAVSIAVVVQVYRSNAKISQNSRLRASSSFQLIGGCKIDVLLRALGKRGVPVPLVYCPLFASTLSIPVSRNRSAVTADRVNSDIQPQPSTPFPLPITSIDNSASACNASNVRVSMASR